MLYGLSSSPLTLSVRLVVPVRGALPVVRKVTAAAGAAGPPTVVCRNRPRTGETAGNRMGAFAASPRLDHSAAVNTWPTLLARRSVKIPAPPRNTLLGENA